MRAERLRARRFPPRLGAGTGEPLDRTDEHQLEAAPGPAGRALIWVMFSSKDYAPCPRRSACCRAPQDALLASVRTIRGAARRAPARDDRSLRSILRHTRYRGQPKAYRGHILVATGLNFLRLGEWFAGAPRSLGPLAGRPGDRSRREGYTMTFVSTHEVGSIPHNGML